MEHKQTEKGQNNPLKLIFNYADVIMAKNKST